VLIEIQYIYDLLFRYLLIYYFTLLHVIL